MDFAYISLSVVLVILIFLLYPSYRFKRFCWILAMRVITGEMHKRRFPVEDWKYYSVNAGIFIGGCCRDNLVVSIFNSALNTLTYVISFICIGLCFYWGYYFLLFAFIALFIFRWRLNTNCYFSTQDYYQNVDRTILNYLNISPRKLNRYQYEAFCEKYEKFFSLTQDVIKDGKHYSSTGS